MGANVASLLERLPHSSLATWLISRCKYPSDLRGYARRWHVDKNRLLAHLKGQVCLPIGGLSSAAKDASLTVDLLVTEFNTMNLIVQQQGIPILPEEFTKMPEVRVRLTQSGEQLYQPIDFKDNQITLRTMVGITPGEAFATVPTGLSLMSNEPLVVCVVPLLSGIYTRPPDLRAQLTRPTSELWIEFYRLEPRGWLKGTRVALLKIAVEEPFMLNVAGVRTGPESQGPRSSGS